MLPTIASSWQNWDLWQYQASLILQGDLAKRDTAIAVLFLGTHLQVPTQDMFFLNVKKYTKAEAFEYLLW